MCLPDTTVRITVRTVRAVIQTVVSLKLHAMSMRPYTTVWMTARTVCTVIRTVVSCFLTRASMGKSNYYDKLKWQDSIKVIITQKLHQIRNWEFHNMLNGMSTIEMIENLKIKNLTENQVIRRFGWPPTICVQEHCPGETGLASLVFQVVLEISVVLLSKVLNYLSSVGLFGKETMQLVSGKVEFDACQVSSQWHNSFLVNLWTFQPILVYICLPTHSFL